MPVSFVDTNVVLYAIGSDDAKYNAALKILANMPTISTQVMNETANTMRRKLGYTVEQTRNLLLRLEQETRVHIVVPQTIWLALDISNRYRFSHYDSLIIAAALQSGCDILYSEDMQHGQLIEKKLTIVNPFVR